MSRKYRFARPLALTAAVAAAMAIGTQPAFAQQSQAAMHSDSMLSNSAADTDDGASVASAHVIEGSPQTKLIMSGDAELRRAGTVIKGEKLVYTQADDTVTAEGGASISQGGTTVSGSDVWYRLDTRKGEAKNVEYEHAPSKMRGDALCALFSSGEGKTELDDAVLTTCRKGDNSWWIEFDKLTLDQYEQEGVGTGAVLKLGGVPVIGAPWFTFPISAQRKSGLLAPTMGFSGDLGFDLAVPYYFNIAPNYDYTFTPRLLTYRGVMLGNEFRFKQKYLEGTLNVDYIPHDRDFGDDRYGLTGTLKGAWNGFGYGLNYNRVSDKDFIDDFSTSIREDDNNVIDQNYWLTYGAKYWNAAIRVSKNQAINEYADNPNQKPYEKVPQMTWNGHVADFHGFALSSVIDATRFRHAAKQYVGDRLAINQSIAYPIQAPGWFLTPKAQIRSVHYSLEKDQKDPDYTVPTFSLDAGMVFERDTSIFARDVLQTLEPRVFYSYTPERKFQKGFQFDTDEADTNFASIFNDYRYTGYDVLGYNNSVTAAVTSRFLDSETGLEVLRASVGQRFHVTGKRFDFGSRTVVDDSENVSGELLASVGARLTREISANAYLEYSPDRNDLDKVTAGIRWQPRPMSTVSLYYRYNYDKVRFIDNPEDSEYIKQIDLSAQWPITSRLYALARQNYALDRHRFVESLVGLEYHADCWTLRTVFQHYRKDDDKIENNYFVQLELNGLGSIGNNPLSELQKGISGYQTRAPLPSTIGTYDYYQ